MDKESIEPSVLELDLLKGQFDGSLRESDNAPLYPHLISGSYLQIIEAPLCRKIFEDRRACECDYRCVFSSLVKCTKSALEESCVKDVEVLLIGVACLQAFIQANWTSAGHGVPSEICSTPWLLNRVPSDLIEAKGALRIVQECLSIDGEDVCHAIYFPEYLLLAKVCFEAVHEKFTTSVWWMMRCLYIHQQVLDEHSSTLQSRLLELSESVKCLPWLKEHEDLQVLHHLEIARIHLHYGKINVSEKEINSAMHLLGMEVGLVGAMGKRTQYQLREIAQLVLQVKTKENKTFEKQDYPQNFPKDITLDDDVRLPKIIFNNPRDCEYPDMSHLEQATLLAVFVQKKKSQAKDRLLKEELMPYLNCLLSQPKVWPIHLASLLFRSRLESDHRRTIERALLQTQALMNLENYATPANVRLNLFYCSYAPPHFVIAADCATILVSIGSIQSALDIYLQLQLWEEVIACYNHLKLRHKSAEIIREQLKKGESVKLLCYLGDATDDVSCYEKAWELSGHRSAQAQRHWGMFYFNRQHYKESMSHLKKSLEINSLQVSMWFRLGYAALMEHDWEESASAYRRYCALEPDSFEAWNNLAKAYILLGQKHRAYTALHEAIKCNYETWQVWDNLMAVSSDCGDFEGVINCYHRILDLKEKHIDEQILTVLTAVIVKGIKDNKGVPASAQKKKALELFGRITSKVMSNATVWQLYARLTASLEEQSAITKSKTAQYLQKAHTAAVQDYNWCKDFDSIKNVVKLCQSLAEAYSICKKHCTSPKEAVQLLSSAQMSLRSVLTKIQMEHTDAATGTIHKLIQEDYNLLQSTYDSLETDIQEIRNTMNA